MKRAQGFKYATLSLSVSICDDLMAFLFKHTSQVKIEFPNQIEQKLSVFFKKRKVCLFIFDLFFLQIFIGDKFSYDFLRMRLNICFAHKLKRLWKQ